MIRNICLVGTFLVASVIAADSAKEQIVTYEEHIRPIFRAHCFKCHGEQEQKGGLALDTYAEVLKGGNGDEVLKAGRPNSSTLFLSVAREGGDDVPGMPPKQGKIPDAEIELIRKWIQGGLVERAGGKSRGPAQVATEFKPTAAVAMGNGPMPQIALQTPPATVRTGNSVTALASSPNAPLAAVAGYEIIKLIHTEKRETLGNLPFPEGVPNVLRFSQDGSLLLAAGGRGMQLGKVVLFDVKSGKRVGEFGDEIDEILTADISPDLKLVAFGGPGKLVKVCNTSDGVLRYKLSKHTDWITALEFSPDGERLASADRAGGLHIWEADSGGILLSLNEHKDSINSLSWRGDSAVLATGGEDGQLIVWDVKEGWPMASTKPHEPKAKGKPYGKLQGGVLCVKFANDGRLLTVGRDKALRYWTFDGKKVSGIENLPTLPTRVTTTYDGKRVLVGDLKGELQCANGGNLEPFLIK